MAATLPARRVAVIPGRVSDAELLDLELGAVERARRRRGRAPRPVARAECLVERHVAPLEPHDEVVELALEVLERARLRQGRTSSTRAARPPRASSTSTRLPGRRPPASRTTRAAGPDDRVAAREGRERRERLQADARAVERGAAPLEQEERSRREPLAAAAQASAVALEDARGAGAEALPRSRRAPRGARRGRARRGAPRRSASAPARPRRGRTAARPARGRRPTRPAPDSPRRPGRPARR